MTAAELLQKIESLTPELQQEVADFVDFIGQRHRHHISEPLDLSWAGALRELHDQFTSVELQHAIADIRSGER